MVSLGQKDMIFGVIEASIGMATAVSFSATGGGPCWNTASYRALSHEGCLAGLVPILMRWSLKFWQSGSLPKLPEMVICIWAAACYLVGGAFIIICDLDNNGGDSSFYIPPVFAIIVGVVTLIDMIMGLI